MLNGKKVASTDNMFREWQMDVKEFLKEGENELHIVFRSPIVEGLKKYDAQGYVIPASDNDQAENGEVEGGKRVSIYTRKAGYHFGWDWGPRLVTSGIWRPVYLQAWDEAKIEDLQIIQNSVEEDKATFTAVFEVDAAEKGKAVFSVKNEQNKLAEASINLMKGINKYTVNFEIENPKLWWTVGLGDPYLYNLTGELSVQGRTTSKDTRIGIRTLELVR
jgi:beta-mannosidase